ncbi:MAG TPA: YetF domain-containing protein [Opitutaceae bacterium]|nr:YetF domain-containing protein [Opitutaceae bacterium]
MHFISLLLGLDVPASQLEFSHMAWRTVAVFAFSILLLKLAHKRFLGKNSGIDVMLAVLLGSVLSRAINGQAQFFPTLGACAVLVVLHRCCSAAAFHFHSMALLFGGRDHILVREGQIDWDAMCESKITKEDLLENVRLNGNTASLQEVKEARLERNGVISVVKSTPYAAGQRLSHQKQHNQNKENGSQGATGSVAPASAVRPARQRAQKKNENDNE